MAGRTIKFIIALALIITVSTALNCYAPLSLWEIMREPEPMRMEKVALGPLHPYVPNWVLYIDERCTLNDELGNPMTNLSVIRGGIVTIWNESGTTAYIDFGDAFAPPGDVTLSPEWGVWRRVRMGAPVGGCNVYVTCAEVGENSITTYALPETLVTPPPKP